jgi:hypothetical protein
VEPRSFRAGRGELHRQLSATLAALGRNRAARNRQQAARARHDMRAWQVGRRKRTRQLIELGGLVVKARVVDLTGDDRAIILGALLWMADKLKSNQGEQARALWAAKGKEAFALERATDAPAIARLGACESARGPDADRYVKLLIQFAVEGSLSGAYSHPSVQAPYALRA